MCALASGESLDSRFDLIRPLGRGGMAEVWLVRDNELGEEVAAKIVPPGATEETVALLRRECQNARRLAHPSIVRVFDFHRGDRRSFITMAFVEGEELTALRGGSPREILRALIPVTEALSYAHAQGVVHRDLKAENILRDAAGRTHVLDFGIAAVLAACGEQGPTATGEPGRTTADRVTISGGGSRNAMSPQQLDRAEPAPADDIYALGALIHDLIAGGPPLGPNVSDERIRSGPPEPLTSSHPLPERLRALVARMLAKSAVERPGEMGQVGTELKAILEELEQAPPRVPSDPGKVRLIPPPRTEPVRAVTPQTPAAAVRPSRSAYGQQRRHAWIAAAWIAPLALLAVLVVWLLPRWVENNKPTPSNPAIVAQSAERPDEPSAAAEELPQAPLPPETQLPSSDDLKARAMQMQQVEEAAERANSFRQRLEARGAPSWAAEEFDTALGPLRRGDEQRSRREYADARTAYDEATRAFEAIAASGPDRLREALERGRRALADGDAGAAKSAFGLAATIDPGSAAARTGLQRAGVLDQVLALIDAGAADEHAGRIGAAESNYRRAAELDPMSQPAQQALARIRSRKSDDAFAAEMSRGLEALERGEHDAAREAFGRAGRMRPNSPEIAEALLQVQQSQSLDAIVRYQEEATAAEAREDWHTAADRYDAILKLDATIRFAQEGHQRSSDRADLADRLDYHLAHPGRLSTEEVLEEALELLVEASEVEPAGPKHRQRVAALDRLVDVAATPLPVVLLSDTLTQVIVYKVGRMGAFERRELELRPGVYTVVGSRPGYRDVRKNLVVEAGKSSPPLTVICEEPI